jgi:hypothetical protein
MNREGDLATVNLTVIITIIAASSGLASRVQDETSDKHG